MNYNLDELSVITESFEPSYEAGKCQVSDLRCGLLIETESEFRYINEDDILSWLLYNVDKVTFFLAEYTSAMYLNFPLSTRTQVKPGENVSRTVIAYFEFKSKRSVFYLKSDTFNKISERLVNFKDQKATYLEKLEDNQRKAYINQCRKLISKN
ncbi:hypothetical protein KNT81_gp261 [Proteus phage phiP4-3]|uniref:Uncharacterized protein n=1 Tax=Proteus phage phiP4-3 TaxID=2065203 RepID=A0A2I6PFK9_9CAUD|nr:hypothetical protein KNT81_gp261 [Proteus phage phiP4-3]AUM58510.1 hypothetical protein phiP43_152 [Proteus phage phiP4-3]